MRILLLSAYDAASHGYWHKALTAQFPSADWTVLTLPPRYFAWRLRGNSLSWAFGERQTLEQGYDLVIATSMTDLSALRGFVPALASTPTIVYFHENQFAYPESGKEYGSVEPKILNIYTALAADRVLFNTDYNRQTFLKGARALLKKLPDQVPAGVIDRIEQSSAVLPVPLPEPVFLPHQPQPGPLQLIWNHRWEFDKGPELLLAMLAELDQRGIDIRLHMVGQQFRRMPAVFDQILADYPHLLGRSGFIDSVAEYRQLLQQAEIVLSTALHDFQGIAVLEAVAAGCIPLVPDRLAYPELFPADCLYRSGKGETEDLVARIATYAAAKAKAEMRSAPAIHNLGWERLRPDYANEMATVSGFGID